MNQGNSRSIRHLPPSAKLLYKILESGEQMTQKELVARTSLSGRTIRYAIKRLKEEGFIVERYYFTDARQSLYSLDEGVIQASTA